jgi:type VI secretion system secreted protein VgrG
MTSPHNQPFIVIGDKTSHGGTVVGGATTSSTHGKRIARVGDPVTCPQCGHSTTIATGDDTMIVMGRAVARHGDKTACGATLIASQSVTTGSPGGGGGTTGSPSPAQARGPASAADSATPPEPVALGDDPAATDSTPPKVLVTLRIGMFFDGTANNADNARIGEQCRAMAKDQHEEAVLLAGCQHVNDTSYGDSETNVRKLFTLYPDSTLKDATIASGGDYFIPLYIQGDGTQSGQGDSTLGLATGDGDTGMLQRVQDAFYVELKHALDLFAERYPYAYAQAVELDIFGFSRGAAEARHFLHLVNQRGHGPLGDVLPGANLKLKPGFAWKTDLRAGFVGLFDTVSHLGVAPDTSVAGSAAIGFYLCLPEGCATRGVVHLTARDECRVNFPLTSAAPPHTDLPLPGVHSDIGGGYLDGAEEVVWLIRPIIGDENAMRPLEATRPYREAQRQLQHLQTQDPANAASMRVHAWSVAQPTVESSYTRWGGSPMQTVAATVEMRRTLSNGYAGIPLRAMYVLAKKAGIPWNQSPDDMPSMRVPDELWAVQASVLSHVQMGQAPYLSPDQERMLCQRYLHHSADWHLSGDSVSPVALFYVNRPTEDDRRVVLPNEDKA